MYLIDNYKSQYSFCLYMVILKQGVFVNTKHLPHLFLYTYGVWLYTKNRVSETNKSWVNISYLMILILFIVFIKTMEELLESANRYTICPTFEYVKEVFEAFNKYSKTNELSGHVVLMCVNKFNEYHKSECKKILITLVDYLMAYPLLEVDLIKTWKKVFNSVSIIVKYIETKSMNNPSIIRTIRRSDINDRTKKSVIKTPILDRLKLILDIGELASEDLLNVQYLHTYCNVNYSNELLKYYKENKLTPFTEIEMSEQFKGELLDLVQLLDETKRDEVTQELEVVGGGKNIYKNSQNVHVLDHSSIIDVYDYIEQNTHVVTNNINLYNYFNTGLISEDGNSMIKTEDIPKIYVAERRIDDDSIKFLNRFTLRGLVDLVCSFADQVGSIELKQRIMEEIIESIDTCTSGYVTRILMAFVGYIPINIEVNMKKDIISSFLVKLDKELDPETIRTELKTEYSFMKDQDELDKVLQECIDQLI